MARMELSLTRGKDRSPLRETLTSNKADEMGYNNIIMPSHPHYNNGVEETATTTTVGLHHELFSYLINRSRTKKFCSLIIIASLVWLIVEYTLYQNVHISSFTWDFLEWLGHYGDIAVLCYVVMMSVLTLLFVPPSIFVFASGFIFRNLYGSSWCGIVIAWIASFIGTMIGGSLGFWRARFLSRDLVQILLRRYPILRAVDVAIVKNSLRVMMLMRLNPLLPFGVMNYIFGISGVDLPTFILAMPAVLPWYLFLVCLGAVSSKAYIDGIDLQGNVLGVIFISTGVASGILGLVITWRFAKKELQKDAEMDKWRMVEPEEMPEVGARSRSPTPTSMMLVVLPPVIVPRYDENDEEKNLSRNNRDSSSSHNDGFANNDDMKNNVTNDYIHVGNSDNTTKSSEQENQVARQLQFSSKSSENEATTTSIDRSNTHRYVSSNTNVIIEQRDLGFADYFRTQVLGEDQYQDNTSNNANMQHSYRKNLNWTEIILDDFS